MIIPILNEAGRIASVVRRLRDLQFGSIIVADGGSTDGGDRLAAAAGAKVIRTGRGRGLQMNAGACAGRAPHLLFLHADTSLPGDAADVVARALGDRRCVAGCFRLRFDSPRPLLRLFAWFSRFETMATTFGDQAFFVRRAAFSAVGGFPEQPLLEDVELRRRLKRLGRFAKVREQVMTSARRYEAEGVLRRQALNAMILLLYALGVPARRVARWYA